MLGLAKRIPSSSVYLHYILICLISISFFSFCFFFFCRLLLGARVACLDRGLWLVWRRPLWVLFSAHMPLDRVWFPLRFKDSCAKSRSKGQVFLFVRIYCAKHSKSGRFWSFKSWAICLCLWQGERYDTMDHNHTFHVPTNNCCLKNVTLTLLTLWWTTTIDQILLKL